MNNILIKLIGWHATILHEDPCAYDRYKWLKKNIKKGTIKTLDAGCGLGTFSFFAAKKGNVTTGLSFDEKANKQAIQNAKILKLENVKFEQCDLRYLDKFKNNLDKFDQIICFETIEHILDDKKLIKDLSNLLRPGGKLLLTTPFKNYKKLWRDKLSQIEDGGHVRRGYTHEEIEKIFNSAELSIVKQDYVSGFISQQLTNFSRILSTKINQRLAWFFVLPLRIFQLLDPVITNFLKYPYLSIAVISIKK
ncbi:MAG: methyltransferase domain-containing protein [bacterium]